MKTVTIATLGCKVNQFESESLMASIEEKGYRLVLFGEKADITIINTCTVTHRADFQSRQLIRKAQRTNPESLIVVTGCYAQVDPERLGGIEGVSYVIGNSEKDGISEILDRLETNALPKLQVSDIQRKTVFSDRPLSSFHSHTRGFLKIQDGCDAACSYCIVPSARGPSRSMDPAKVLSQLQVLKTKGYCEVVLTGIHIGAYGRDLSPPTSLERLLEEVERRETPERIRLSSIEPLEITDSFIAILSGSSKICPHLHIPIQSGDDETLRRMNRPYDSSFVAELLTELHRRIEDIALGVDVIVGFPGETEERFEKTFRLIESLPVSYLHVFPFSKRRGTPAAQFPDQVKEIEIKKRAFLLRDLGQRKRKAFYCRFVNRELPVLIEDRRDEETKRWRGLSRNYIAVFLQDDVRDEDIPRWVNQEWPVVITEVKDDGVEGRVAEGARERDGIHLLPILRAEGQAQEINSERLALLKELEDRLGYRFKDISLFHKALTHKSFSHQVYPEQAELSAKGSNEVLEFLGDAVLGLAVSHLLLERFPDAQEGILSKKRSHLVQQSSLALFAGQLELERGLLLGKGELLTGGRQKASILANAYEAVIGAIYMDAGFEEAMEVVGHHLGEYLVAETAPPFALDYKSLLQEFTQKTYGVSPKYHVLKESGPDHEKLFCASVMIGGEVRGTGWGRNKKSAEQNAAKNALESSQPTEAFSGGMDQEGCQ